MAVVLPAMNRWARFTWPLTGPKVKNHHQPTFGNCTQPAVAQHLTSPGAGFELGSLLGILGGWSYLCWSESSWASPPLCTSSNVLIGPIAFKLALDKAGETEETRERTLSLAETLVRG